MIDITLGLTITFMIVTLQGSRGLDALVQPATDLRVDQAFILAKRGATRKTAQSSKATEDLVLRKRPVT